MTTHPNADRPYYLGNALPYQLGELQVRPKLIAIDCNLKCSQPASKPYPLFLPVLIAPWTSTARPRTQRVSYPSWILTCTS